MSKKKEIIKKKISKKDLIKVFFRSNFLQGSWNFERMQAMGFCFSMIPIIKKLYPKNDENRKEALKRHLEFFNTHPYMFSPILGVTIAMEEKKSKFSGIKSSVINGIKVGLMGPLAGVGDPIFWGTIRPILAALGATFAIAGNIFGPILFFSTFNLVRLSTKYYGLLYGYKKGANIVEDIKGGVLQKITEGSSILGLFVMGALVNKWTHINIPVVISRLEGGNGDSKITTLQNVLDQLMPGIVPLILTFFCIWLLNKKINALWIIVSFFIFGILGYWLGILN
ncbi:PTS mannose transporter subunit IID [bacterium endosymbiont of Pedicinus badii]|uniref:PTS mannose transporter subunit IID n=1 Tax=bacterium endosymbiont of Pedicinus badii TaxID=1719126 RepID=UPI0009B9E888|nr:PTS mannose transporter subunit IID [bacterium endosymbiont of Pedicinus badii]OQM34421.1 PTS mannose transporter subunit IID [bacterium endosymbiont of Pedicinus badii]